VKVSSQNGPRPKEERGGGLTKQAMEVHLAPGTQRLEDPVSRTTLKS